MKMNKQKYISIFYRKCAWCNSYYKVSEYKKVSSKIEGLIKDAKVLWSHGMCIDCYEKLNEDTLHCEKKEIIDGAVKIALQEKKKYIEKVEE